MCSVLRQGSEVCNWYQLANSPSLQSRRILLCDQFGLSTDRTLGRVKKWFNTIKRLLRGYNSPVQEKEEHKCLKTLQSILILHFTPSLHFTLSLQSAFYTQSAFYPWSAVCSLQSAVCSLQSAFYTDHFCSYIPDLKSRVPPRTIRSLFTPVA